VNDCYTSEDSRIRDTVTFHLSVSPYMFTVTSLTSHQYEPLFSRNTNVAAERERAFARLNAFIFTGSHPGDEIPIPEYGVTD
jgi:hypothetical protein